MRCKDFKRLMIECSPEQYSRDKLRMIEQHSNSCIECARFQEDLGMLRRYLSTKTAPAPPDQLNHQTRSLCFTALQEPTKEQVLPAASPSVRIPRYVWAALSLLIVLTGIFIFPFFKELTLSPSFHSLMTLTLMIQNGVMLCLAPILLRKYREKNQDSTI